MYSECRKFGSLYANASWTMFRMTGKTKLDVAIQKKARRRDRYEPKRVRA